MYDVQAVKCVFLDTSTYLGIKFDFNSRNFKILKSLIDSDVVQVVSTDITINEIKNRSLKELETYSKALLKLNNEIHFVSELRGSFSIIQKFDLNVARDELFCWLDKHFKSMAVNVLDTGKVNSKDVFSRYFNKTPPFSTAKKNEFPDAFVLLRLSMLLQQGYQAVCVVSKDPDFKAFCSDVDGMFYYEDIPRFLDSVAKEDVLYSILSLYIEEKRDEIVSESRRFFLDHGFYLSDRDGDVDDVEIISVDIDEVDIVEIDDTMASVGLKMIFECSFYVSFDDPERGWYDDEEGEWIPYDTVSIKLRRAIEKEVDIEIELEDGEAVGFRIASYLQPVDLEVCVDEDDEY